MKNGKGGRHRLGEVRMAGANTQEAGKKELCCVWKTEIKAACVGCGK